MSNFVSEFESKHHIIKLEKNAYIGTFNDYSFLIRLERTSLILLE